MNDAAIFRELPETFPEKDEYKKPSLVSSAVFHVVLIAVLVVVPAIAPQTISERELLIAMVSPLPPPPAAAPPLPPVEVLAAAKPKHAKPPVQTVAPEALVMPTDVPKEIARIADEPIFPTTGVAGGVPGGMPGGVAGGVLGGMLATQPKALPAALPPPPPPSPSVAAAPTGPVHVGGLVREPRIVKLVPPVYPILAAKARVGGTVVLEAVLTTGGSVDQIRVIEGHPLLIDAAIDCVKQWQYEPTLLNNIPVPVILTARVKFIYKNISE